jgi:tetratricopeptide (TPR) repeat protein
MALAAMGVVAIALLGVWLFQNRELGVQDIGSKPTSSLPAIPARDPNVNLKTANTATVTSMAIEQFSQGKLATGQTAVEELLNRGALEQASAALAVVPRTQIDNPSVSFLSGRLAWQSVQAGSKDYNVSDARRYWETAHRAQPKSSTYLNALGFAYYAEGNFDRANQAWFDALYLIDASKPGETATGDTAKQEALTIYAGLAMGLYKSAQKQPVDKRAALLSESLKLRQKVITDDPLNFQPNALSKNWLWTDKAIKDWRSLLATSN